VDEHELAARRHQRDHRGVATRRVKQRNHQQTGLLRRIGIGRRYRLAAPHEASRQRIRPDQHPGARIAVRADGALGFARRARSVKDRGIVVRVERHVWQRPVRQQVPGIDVAGNRFKLGDLRMRHMLALAADENALQRRTIVQMLEQPLEPLAIDDRDLGARIVETKFELGTAPPGIEQSRDAAHEQTAEQCRRPFRHIAHGDGDAIAFANSGLLQRLGDGERGAGETLIARALIAIDDERLVAIGAAQKKDFAHGRRRVFPHPRADAANVAFLDLERRTRLGQRRIGLRKRNGWECLRCRHGLSLTLTASRRSPAIRDQ